MSCMNIRFSIYTFNNEIAKNRISLKSLKKCRNIRSTDSMPPASKLKRPVKSFYKCNL